MDGCVYERTDGQTDIWIRFIWSSRDRNDDLKYVASLYRVSEKNINSYYWL